jgi:hypothetical protein
VELDCPSPSATDGEIAAINLESARRRAWARFAQDARLPGVAEMIVDNERLAAQFLGDLDALDRRQAFSCYDDVSPFPLARVCFQLGMLWGRAGGGLESRCALVSPRDCVFAGLCEGACTLGGDLREPGPNQGCGGATGAGAFEPRSGSPVAPCRRAHWARKVRRWRKQLDAARLGFEELLGRHLLAFADHAAEFYAGSGNNFRRALELAGANVANRPTRLAVKQVQTLALNVDEGARN